MVNVQKENLNQPEDILFTMFEEQHDPFELSQADLFPLNELEDQQDQ
jgi:hypothetical protein